LIIYAGWVIFPPSNAKQVPQRLAPTSTTVSTPGSANARLGSPEPYRTPTTFAVSIPSLVTQQIQTPSDTRDEGNVARRFEGSPVYPPSPTPSTFPLLSVVMVTISTPAPAHPATRE